MNALGKVVDKFRRIRGIQIHNRRFSMRDLRHADNPAPRNRFFALPICSVNIFHSFVDYRVIFDSCEMPGRSTALAEITD